jgi:hypothetical protein
MILDNSPLSYVFHPGEPFADREAVGRPANVQTQITPFRSRAGLATRLTMSSCISSHCSKAFSMSPTCALCLRCGWVCPHRRSQVATLRVVVFCTFLSNIMCIIVVGYADAEQLAIVVEEEIPKKFLFYHARIAPHHRRSRARFQPMICFSYI